MSRKLAACSLAALAGAAMLALSMGPASAFTLSSPSLGQPVAASQIDKICWHCGWGGGWHGGGWGGGWHGGGWHGGGWGGGWHHGWGPGWGGGWRHCWINQWGNRVCNW